MIFKLCSFEVWGSVPHESEGGPVSEVLRTLPCYAQRPSPFSLLELCSQVQVHINNTFCALLWLHLVLAVACRIFHLCCRIFFFFNCCWLLFSHSVVYASLQPHGLQHATLPCPSPTPRASSNSRPSSRWCHPTISSSVVPFSSCPQALQASEVFSLKF